MCEPWLLVRQLMAMQMNRVNRKVGALMVVPGCSKVSVAASSHIFGIPDMTCIPSVGWLYSNASGCRLDGASFHTEFN